MPRIALVTDSTATLPSESAWRLGIAVVPLQVIIRGEPHREADPETSSLLVEALRAKDSATTSGPSPEDFAAVYRAAAATGATGVVSLHLSAELSATVKTAELAAKDAPIPVRVIDSRTVAMALGFAAVAAAEAGRAGKDLEAVAEVAQKQSAAASAFFYVDTLEFLRRGGRIGSARALLGSALAMKPILHVADGRVEPLEKVRTSAKAIARLAEIAVERVGGDGGSVDLAVQHLAAPERAGELAERLAARLPGLREVTVSEVGAVIGAHVGPGVLGVIVAPR
jgi:DegV family protein with EDD domain